MSMRLKLEEISKTNKNKQTSPKPLDTEASWLAWTRHFIALLLASPDEWG